MNKSKIILGIYGRIEVEIGHTGIGTEFILYDNYDSSFRLAVFDEVLPIGGSKSESYTELFLIALLKGKGVINFRTHSIRFKRIQNSMFITADHMGSTTTALFNNKQIKELTDYLTDYIDTLPQDIRENTKKS